MGCGSTKDKSRIINHTSILNTKELLTQNTKNSNIDSSKLSIMNESNKNDETNRLNGTFPGILTAINNTYCQKDNLLTDNDETGFMNSVKKKQQQLPRRSNVYNPPKLKNADDDDFYSPKINQKNNNMNLKIFTQQLSYDNPNNKEIDPRVSFGLNQGFTFNDDRVNSHNTKVNIQKILYVNVDDYDKENVTETNLHQIYDSPTFPLAEEKGKFSNSLPSDLNNGKFSIKLMNSLTITNTTNISNVNQILSGLDEMKDIEYA